MTDIEWAEAQRACFRRTYERVKAGKKIRRKKPPGFEMEKEEVLEKQREYNRVYREKHKEELLAKQREYSRVYRESHREEMRAKEVAYREEHKEELRVKNKVYYTEHRDEICARRRERRTRLDLM